MKLSELGSILAAIVVVTIVISFPSLTKSDFSFLPLALFFAAIIILVNIFAKKLMALMLDSAVEHRILGFYRFGFAPHWHFKKEIPIGIILPLFFTLVSWGILKIMPILVYETTALKTRAAKRFGYYSYTEMSDWHNGLIGTAGIVATLILALIAYFLPGTMPEYLAQMAAFYAGINLVPISNLDGTQILFGSKVLWATLAIITLIFVGYAIAI